MTVDNTGTGQRPKPRVFVSYRRSDAQGWAGHLQESLSQAFGESLLFFDLISIAPGEDFVAAITRAISTEGVVIALIGPTWLTTSAADGRRRLDSPDDVVRAELETALGLGARVIPVLVGGAEMPKAVALPESLRGLAQRNALELTDARWQYDFDRLVAGIESATGLKRQHQATKEQRVAGEVRVGASARFDNVHAGNVTGLRSAGPLAADKMPGKVEVLGDATVTNSKLGDITGVSIGPDSKE